MQYYYGRHWHRRRVLAGALLPFLDEFARGDGVLGAPWESGGATWAIASNEAVNTPTEGSELITNGNFAAWTADDPDGWTVIAESGDDPEVSEAATGEAHVDTPTPGGGMCNLYTSAGVAIHIRQAVQTEGSWYVCTLDIDTVTAGGIKINRFASVPAFTSTGSKIVTGRATAVNFEIMRNAGAADVTFDNVSLKALTLNTLFTDVDDGATKNVIIQAELDTVVADTQAGLVLNLDDENTPANFVIAYHDGTNAVLEKCVAGTYTSVISAAAAYGAGQILQVIKSGTSYSLYYNSVQVGTTQTVSDAGIISNTKHGLFSTNSGNQLDNFSLQEN